MILKKISNLELDIDTKNKFCFDDIQVSVSDEVKQTLTPENIREGVTILGVNGVAKDGSSVNDTYNISIDTLIEKSVVFNKTDSVKYKKVVIPKLEVTSDPNLKSQYIRSNVSILGVTGSLVVNEDNIKDNAKEYNDSEYELFDTDGQASSTLPREFNAPSGYTCFKNLRFKNLNINRYNLNYKYDLYYSYYDSEGAEVRTKLTTGIYYGNIVERPSQDAQGNTSGNTEVTNYINTDIYCIPTNLSTESEIKEFIKEFSTGNTLFRCQKTVGMFTESTFYLYVQSTVGGYNLFEYKQ